jgi:MoxR-like ATPase
VNNPLRSAPDHTLPLGHDAQLTTRLRELRDALSEGLIERDLAIRLALLAALAGEHLILHGPPGTAKSLVARRLQVAFRGATYFERLLTRFSVPEELFGPLSIKGLEEDRYHRLTKGYLPAASVAFLDEIFKANSAILNALLTLLNEREFDNGAERETTPLVSVVAASNELPEGEELGALFDRFLLRLHVGPVSKAGFTPLLQLRGSSTVAVPEGLALSTADVERVQTLAQGVTVPTEVESLLTELRDWCTSEGIYVSDRRWRKVVKLLQVSAATHGRSHVSVWDAWLLQHCLWNEPGQREKLYTWYASRVGAARGMDPTRLVKLVTSMEAQLERDRTEKAQARNEQGHLLYETIDGRRTHMQKGAVRKYRNGAPLFLAPQGASVADHYDRHTKVADRTNGGKGYSADELASLHVEVGGRRHPFSGWTGAGKYCDDSSNWLATEEALPPAIEPMRHKAVHIEHCRRQTTELRQNIVSYQEGLEQHIADLEALVRAHLWVTSDFVEPASATLRSTQEQVSKLLARVAKIESGIEKLPREAAVSSP